MTNQWIDRYTFAVTRQLPDAQRADIDRELHGLIEDLLEARTQGREATDEDVEAVLAELGDPTRLADKYRGHERFLIGPDLYPTYLIVLKIVLGAVTLGMVVVFVIQTILKPNEVPDHLWTLVVTLLSAWIQGFAWVTISMGLAEYFRAREGKDPGRLVPAWKVSDLPQLPERRLRIRRADPIASIILAVLFVVALTFALDLFGIWVFLHGGPGVVVPFLNPAVFNQYLPFVWAVALLGIFFEIAKLIARRWSLRLIALNIGVDAANFALSLALFSNPAIWNADFMAQLSQTGLVPAGSEAFRTMSALWGQFTERFVWLISLGFAIGLVTTLVRAVQVGQRTNAAERQATR